MLDDGTKRVIGIERMILESSSFDFRYRHAQPLIIKFAKRFNFSKELTQKAWDISIDVYKTLAPLKATPHALALAVLDLAMRLEGRKLIYSMRSSRLLGIRFCVSENLYLLFLLLLLLFETLF